VFYVRPETVSQFSLLTPIPYCDQIVPGSSFISESGAAARRFPEEAEGPDVHTENPPAASLNIKQNQDFASCLSASGDDLSNSLLELVALFESPSIAGQAMRLLWERALSSIRCTCSICSANSRNLNNPDISLLLLISTARALAERQRP